MMDVYLYSDDRNFLASFCSQFLNVIGPIQGKAASAERVLEDGTVVPATDAVGDSNKFYACIRTENAPEIPADIILMSAEEGSAIVGVWA